ncbi:hypothetical protein [Micromonospora sp. 4G55]|uniref:hypothetical protein n=1 Tax=Micromonospora sp. 4G55 TaxID=2806102 RepID=UPI001A60D02B|nr:hypothetical protein [Micromonospora sp. 4G55]MBM0257272.1 hypothetical protein [Micromonospora sp. 4G55]
MSAPKLGDQARTFAAELQDMLNRTVCEYAQVAAVVSKRDTGKAHLGTRLNRQDFSTGKVQMNSTARTRVWLDVSCVLYQNDEGYLTMSSSFCGIYLGDEHQPDLLMHYDYERDKDIYTEAHVQVAGRHEQLEALLAEVSRPDDQMKDLHLPVGGRRLRPSLEDLLESLIAERILDAKPGWEAVLEATRRDYRKRQIAAVVRSNQGTAIKTLEQLGYEVRKRDEGLLAGLRRRRRG